MLVSLPLMLHAQRQVLSDYDLRNWQECPAPGVKSMKVLEAWSAEEGPSLESTYYFDTSGRLAERKGFSIGAGTPRHISSRTQWQYDAAGRVNGMTFSSYHRVSNRDTSDIGKVKASDVCHWTYNAEGLVQESTMEMVSDPHGTSTSKTLKDAYLYDAHGRVVREDGNTIYNTPYTFLTEHEYNAAGLCIRSIRYFEGKVREWNEYEYNDDGLLQVERSMENDGSKPSVVTTYTYRNDNTIALTEKLSWRDFYGEPFVSKDVHHFDGALILQEVSSELVEGQAEQWNSTLTYERTWDGDLLMKEVRTETNSHGSPRVMYSEYSYEYY